MGKGKTLTVEEITKIKLYKEASMSNRAIAKKINRSTWVVNSFVKNKDTYGKNRKSSRNKRNTKLTNRQKNYYFKISCKRWSYSNINSS